MSEGSYVKTYMVSLNVCLPGLVRLKVCLYKVVGFIDWFLFGVSFMTFGNNGIIVASVLCPQVGHRHEFNLFSHHMQLKLHYLGI